MVDHHEIVYRAQWRATIFEMDEQNALAPLGEDERAVVFHSLMGAIALISGIMPKVSSHATEAEKGDLPRATLRCHADLGSANVVRLEERRDNQEPSANKR